MLNLRETGQPGSRYCIIFQDIWFLKIYNNFDVTDNYTRKTHRHIYNSIRKYGYQNSVRHSVVSCG